MSADARGDPATGGAAQPPWYQAGLRFTCTQCGNCCTGEPGFTWVNEAEIAALAQRLGMDAAAFRRRYTRTVWRDGELRATLLEKQGGDCVFFKHGTGCTVYDQRPKQCRTWPFWQRVVEQRQDWDDAARGCPGMDHGTLHHADEISATAADDGL
jgi:hypothetical protein